MCKTTQTTMCDHCGTIQSIYKDRCVSCGSGDLIDIIDGVASTTSDDVIGAIVDPTTDLHCQDCSASITYSHDGVCGGCGGGNFALPQYCYGM
jgi:hypothetical protein